MTTAIHPNEDPMGVAGTVLPDVPRTDATPAALPPDPEGQNDNRALWAEAAVVAFEAQTGTDREDALADLLCDLMHWCDRNGGNFKFALDRARRNYEEETQPEGQDNPEHDSEPDVFEEIAAHFAPIVQAEKEAK